jgi:hypothetical protein
MMLCVSTVKDLVADRMALIRLRRESALGSTEDDSLALREPLRRSPTKVRRRGCFMKRRTGTGGVLLCSCFRTERATRLFRETMSKIRDYQAAAEIFP